MVATRHLSTAIKLDLTAGNTLATANTAMISCYIARSPALVAGLVHAVKEWAAAGSVGVSSYALTLMALGFLQSKACATWAGLSSGSSAPCA